MRKPLPYFPISFPLSRAAWKQLELRDLIGQIPGGEKNPRLYLARLLADRANTDPARQAAGAPWISAGRLITFGLLQDILRYLISNYCTRERPGSLENALAWTRRKRGPMVVDQTVETFVHLFSPQEVHLGLQGEQDYLSGTTFDRPNRIVCVPEAMLLSIASTNPALRSFFFFFDDSDLRKRSLYVDFIAGLEDYFATQPSVRNINLNLFEALRAPQKACPDSLEGQLEYILRSWGELLPESLKRELLIARGMLREETLQRGPVGGGKAEVLSFPKPGARRFPHYPEPSGSAPTWTGCPTW